MKITLEPEKYVVAVSGGVDSVTLLDMLSKASGLTLVVAHFDHGIREDSGVDRTFVEGLAQQYNLPFMYEEGRLGLDASEATARAARYSFLHQVRQTQRAKAIVTAHHQNDLIETLLLNLLRGTNRKGLSSLRSTGTVRRPLLDMPKQALIDYAEAHSLVWHEDSTNLDEKYARNYVRQHIAPRLTASDRQQLLAIVSRISVLNDTIDELLAEQLRQYGQANVLDRQWFVSLPHTVAREVLAAWFRQNAISLDRHMVERAVIAAKTKMAGKQVHLTGMLTLQVYKHKLALIAYDR